MRRLIFAGSGSFGCCINEIVQNACPGVNAIGLKEDELNPESLASLNISTEDVFLVDFQDSQAVVSLEMALKQMNADVEKLLIIAGINVPMAIDAALLKDRLDTLDELCKSLLSEGKASMIRL